MKKTQSVIWAMRGAIIEYICLNIHLIPVFLSIKIDNQIPTLFAYFPEWQHLKKNIKSIYFKYIVENVPAPLEGIESFHIADSLVKTYLIMWIGSKGCKLPYLSLTILLWLSILLHLLYYSSPHILELELSII